MNPEKFAFTVGIAVFVGGSIGLLLHRLLPEKHLIGGGKDMVGAVVGLFTLLSALVLGLLIWTAYGVYSGQNVAIQTLAAKVLQLDLALLRELFDRVSAVQRHQLVAERVVGRAQGDRQHGSAFSAELGHFGYNARSRGGDAPSRAEAAASGVK